MCEMCESCWNAVEMQMQMDLGTIRSLLPALSHCLFFFFFHSFIYFKQLYRDCIFQPDPLEGLLGCDKGERGRGLTAGCGLTKGRGMG